MSRKPCGSQDWVTANVGSQGCYNDYLHLSFTFKEHEVGIIWAVKHLPAIKCVAESIHSLLRSCKCVQH